MMCNIAVTHCSRQSTQLNPLHVSAAPHSALYRWLLYTLMWHFEPGHWTTAIPRCYPEFHNRQFSFSPTFIWTRFHVLFFFPQSLLPFSLKVFSGASMSNCSGLQREDKMEKKNRGGVWEHEKWSWIRGRVEWIGSHVCLCSVCVCMYMCGCMERYKMCAMHQRSIDLLKVQCVCWIREAKAELGACKTLLQLQLSALCVLLLLSHAHKHAHAYTHKSIFGCYLHYQDEVKMHLVMLLFWTWDCQQLYQKCANLTGEKIHAVLFISLQVWNKWANN